MQDDICSEGSGCHYSQIGDGHFDPDCYNEGCNWDGGDCP